MTRHFAHMQLGHEVLSKGASSPLFPTSLMRFCLLLLFFLFQTNIPCFAQQPVDSQSSKSLEAMDTDRSGTISEDEFIADRTNKARRAFERADSNDDGSLSQEEIQAFKDRRGAKVRRKLRKKRKRK